MIHQSLKGNYCIHTGGANSCNWNNLCVSVGCLNAGTLCFLGWTNQWGKILYLSITYPAWSPERVMISRVLFSVTLFLQQVALLYHLARSKWHQTIVADWKNGQALTSVKMFSIQTLKNNQTKSSKCKTTIMGTFKTTSIQLSSHPYKGQIRMQLGCYPDDISAPLNLQHLIPM